MATPIALLQGRTEGMYPRSSDSRRAPRKGDEQLTRAACFMM